MAVGNAVAAVAADGASVVSVASAVGSAARYRIAHRRVRHHIGAASRLFQLLASPHSAKGPALPPFPADQCRPSYFATHRSDNSAFRTHLGVRAASLDAN